MKVVVLSDSHDHVWNLEKVIKDISGKVDAYIHCGDLIAPFIPEILKKINAPGYICFGNNDAERTALQNVGGKTISWAPTRKKYGEVKIGGKNIAFTHYQDIGEQLAKSGKYDAVFHGHTHVARNERFGKTLLVNPGAICGISAGVIFGEKKTHDPASYAIYNTKTNSAKIITIK